MKTKFLAILMVFAVFSGSLFGVPQWWGTPEYPKLNGVVVDWIWRGEIVYQVAEPGGRWKKQEIAAHYLAVVELKGADKKVVEEIRAANRQMEFRHPFLNQKLKGAQVILWIPSEQVHEMEAGAEISLEDYQFGMTERFQAMKCGSFKIDGKKPTVIELESDDEAKEEPSKDSPESGAESK